MKHLIKTKKISIILLSSIVISVTLAVGLGVGLGVGLKNKNSSSENTFNITIDNTKLFLIDSATGIDFSATLKFLDIDSGVNIKFNAINQNPNGTPAILSPNFILPSNYTNLRKFNNQSYEVSGDFASPNGQSIGTFYYPLGDESPNPNFNVSNLILLPGKATYLQTSFLNSSVSIAKGQSLYFPIVPINSDGLSLRYLVLFDGENPLTNKPFSGITLTSANLPTN